MILLYTFIEELFATIGIWLFIGFIIFLFAKIEK